MPRIKHIALTTKDPAKVAAFYKDALGLEEIRRAPNGAVFLTDGYINLAILNWKTEKSADVGSKRHGHWIAFPRWKRILFGRFFRRDDLWSLGVAGTL